MTHNTVSLQVSLPQMLDLALGTPEVGSINLNILHNFLHVLLHQINLTNSKVEYRGDDATRLKTIISSLNTGPSVYLHEYSITDSEGNVTQRDHTPDTSIPAAEIYTTDSKNSIKEGKSSKNTSGSPISGKNFETPVIKKTKGLKQKIGKGIEDNCQSIIFVEPIKDGLVPSALGFKKLNDTVEKLEQQFQSLEDLATNPEIIERIKTGRADPLNDMWSIININKRLDASEQGISKVMTLLQDVIKSEKNVSSLKQYQDDDSNIKVPQEPVNFNDRLTKLKTDVMNINNKVEKLENLIDGQDKSDKTQRKPSKKNKNSSDNKSGKPNEIEMKNLNMSERSSTSSKTDDNESINSKTGDKTSLRRILSGSETTAYMLAVDKDKKNPSVSSKTDDNESINSKTEDKSPLTRILSGSETTAYMLAVDRDKKNPSVSSKTDDNESINSKTEDKSPLTRILSGSETTAYMLAVDKDKKNPPDSSKTDDNESINSKTEDKSSLRRILSGSVTTAYMLAIDKDKKNPPDSSKTDDNESINSKTEDKTSLRRILSGSVTTAYMLAVDKDKKNPPDSSKTDDNESINSETVDKSITSILSGSVTTAYMLAIDKDKKNPPDSSKTDDNESINSKTEDKSSLRRILSGSVTTAYMLAVDKDKKNPSVSSKTDDNESITSKTVDKSITSILSGSVTTAYMLAVDRDKKNPPVLSKTDDNEKINSDTEDKTSLRRILSGSVTTAYMLAAHKDKTQSHLSEHGSSDLHELKLDVETLKDDVAQTKQDIHKIRHEVKQLKANRGNPTDKNIKNNNIVDNNAASINELKSTDSGSSHPSAKNISDTDGLVQLKKYSANTAEASPSITSNTSLPGSKELDTTDNNFITGNNKRKSKSMGVIGDSKKNQNESIKNLESRIAALERKIKVIDDPKNINQSNCIEEIQRLVASMNDIQNDIDKIKQSDAMFNNDKEKHDILIEQIELLKILKADKEDLEDALTDKADTDVVNRKVSYDRFQSTCYDITRNVEDAISKLTQQEKTWKVTLDNIQQEINNKLDRIELLPIEEFITNQLQVVHDKLEDLEEERRKNEAAGTKKILNDVSCISCNKNVTMRMDQGPIYKNNLMSYNGNNKPYLAYSMHRMKKQLKQFPGKNINQFTAALQETRRKKTRRNNFEKSSKEYFSNRYCGGSHTITTPQQRIMRTENYPVEWNPEILNTPRPNVCKPEKNVCCSAFNNQSVLTSINQHQSYEKFETATQQPQNHKEQKYRSSKISLGRQDSKKNQSKQILTESLNSKNILPTITDNKGALKVN